MCNKSTIVIKSSDIHLLNNQTKFEYRNEYLRYLIEEYILNQTFDTYTISSLYNYSIKIKKDAFESINIDSDIKERILSFINQIKDKYGVKLTCSTLIHYALTQDLKLMDKNND